MTTDYPFGNIQMVGKSNGIQLRAMAPRRVSGAPSSHPRCHSTRSRYGVDFWLSAEDLPLPDNRLTIDDDGTPRLTLADENNMEPLKRLRKKFESMLTTSAWRRARTVAICTSTRGWPSRPRHQAGTAKFGSDPASSVLDLDCKAHELDNLYVVDFELLLSIGAVNPTLTIVANALRVGDHLLERMR